MVSPLSRTSFDTREHSAFRLHVRRCAVVRKCAEIQRGNSMSGELGAQRETMQTEEILQHVRHAAKCHNNKQLQESPFKHRECKSGVAADENGKHQHHTCTKTSDICGLITRQPFCGLDYVFHADMCQVARSY